MMGLAGEIGIKSYSIMNSSYAEGTEDPEQEKNDHDRPKHTTEPNGAISAMRVVTAAAAE